LISSRGSPKAAQQQQQVEALALALALLDGEAESVDQARR
jgi:hypothetical protein